ncbi:NAD(P)-binding domain-containing protein [Acinetobacter pittii]|uniref:NAD(P)-binding domain-containing protein n=1 Tax=Acinetobacter pittii TaxID=48296 RepID=UPI003891C316
MFTQESIGIIGMGSMGQAFMRVLSSSYPIFVWNRTPKKYEHDNLQNIQVCLSINELIDKTDLIIILVDKHSSLVGLLKQIDSLKNKIILNCTTLSPNEAIELGQLIQSKSGSLLNSVICNFPRQMGTNEAKLRCSGEPSVWKKYFNFIKLLSPNAEYLGPNPASVNVIDTLTVGLYTTIIISYLESQQLAEKYEISNEELQQRIKNLWPTVQTQIELYNKEISSNSFSESEARISAFHTSSKAFISTYESVGIKPQMLSAMSRILDQAVAAQKKELSISAIFKLISS